MPSRIGFAGEAILAMLVIFGLIVSSFFVISNSKDKEPTTTLEKEIYEESRYYEIMPNPHNIPCTLPSTTESKYAN